MQKLSKINLKYFKEIEKLDFTNIA